MRVRAIEQGFYSGRRRVGAVFEVPDGTTANWFVPVVEQKAAPAPTPAKSKAKPAKPEVPDKGADDLV